MLYHFSELKDLLQRAMSVEVGWPNFRFCFDQFVFPQLTLIWGKQQEMMNWLTKLSGQAHFSWVTEWVWNWWFQLFCTFKPSSSRKFSIIVTDLSTTTEKSFFLLLLSCLLLCLLENIVCECSCCFLLFSAPISSLTTKASP